MYNTQITSGKHLLVSISKGHGNVQVKVLINT